MGGENPEFQPDESFDWIQGQLLFTQECFLLIIIALTGLDRDAIPAIKEALSRENLEPSGSKSLKAGYIKQKRILLNLLDTISLDKIADLPNKGAVVVKRTLTSDIPVEKVRDLLDAIKNSLPEPERRSQ